MNANNNGRGTAVPVGSRVLTVGGRTGYVTAVYAGGAVYAVAFAGDNRGGAFLTGAGFSVLSVR